MKHGDKAKAKSAKAASKTSGKRSKAVAAKTSSKTGKTLKSSKAPAKSSSKPAGGNGQSKGRGPADALGFTNPVVASAFKRAVKKFPTAFRRLTD
jgi:hypothetical protein